MIDLNPRSGTAWLLLLVRKLLRRRTVVWGHVYPRGGAEAKTAGVRRAMRRLADGTISYTHTDAARARADLPGSPVWTATNALYPERDITVAAGSADERVSVIYVGRFVAAKKVSLLVEAFAAAHDREPSLELVLVGDGVLRADIEKASRRLGVSEVVHMPGWIDSTEGLREYYARAFVAVSPGFAGLSLTQAAGFGIRTLVSRDEPHSPEIELAEHGAVRWFETDSVESLAEELLAAWRLRRHAPDAGLSRWVGRNYSAESMAAGILAAAEHDGSSRDAGSTEMKVA
ncbi:glycosyltransferase family 4 protein [Oerskovia flava]|uniref:glycosyltransferase family 4 protein n=1 Tax=Oerskovia flava TaxID=2986422 RepID=UPI0022405653|nr:glycosyltransferase [Oerskovia sp. JB1-3-2]